jgi:hypothetical protein
MVHGVVGRPVQRLHDVGRRGDVRIPDPEGDDVVPLRPLRRDLLRDLGEQVRRERFNPLG